MKFRAKSIALLTALAITSVSLYGCGEKEQAPEETPVKQEQTAEEKDTEEKSNTAETVEITDHAGRTVEIPAPEKLEKVYFTSPAGMIFAYTMNPEKMAGSSIELTEDEAKYLPDLAALPSLGGIQIGSELNKEEIISSGAQIILQVGTSKIKDSDISDADELQDQLDIPVVVVTGLFEEMDMTYELLGEIYGEEERAAELASYAKEIISDVEEKLSDLSEDEKVRVYYAQGPEGLETEPASSERSTILKYAQANNVAEVDAKEVKGRSPVSMEQVLEWNPELIISSSDSRSGTYSHIKEDPVWQEIKAVQDGEVYQTPELPFSWMDRPPSVNRVLGLQWLANLLYPEKYDIDIVENTKEFCSKFYNVELTDEDVSYILEGAVRGDSSDSPSKTESQEQ